MNHPTITLGVCGTFGSPNGFQQCFYQATPFSRSLDLDSKALEVAAGTPLFMLRRDGDTNTVCLAAYSAAREPQSSRRGTFIGSAIVLPAGQYGAAALQALIEELHNDVISAPQNMVDGVLQVSEAVGLTVAEPNNLKAAEDSLQAGRQQFTSVVAGQVALVSGLASQLAQFIQWAFRYFPHFDTLYFTANANTQHNAAQKGMVPILNWPQFESEKEAVVAAEKAAQKQAEESKRADSQRGKKGASPAGGNTAFAEWDETDTQWSTSERKQRVAEHNNLLAHYNSLAAQYQIPDEPAGKSPKPKKAKKVRRLNRYKIAFFVLALLVAGAGSYLLFAGSQQRKANEAAAIAIANRQKAGQAPLNPAPNATLDSTLRATLFPGSLRGFSADSITAIVYANAATRATETWPQMQAQYRNTLVAANPGCFVGTGNAYWFVCDSLPVLPVRR